MDNAQHSVRIMNQPLSQIFRESSIALHRYMFPEEIELQEHQTIDGHKNVTPEPRNGLQTPNYCGGGK
jgi:hypothetical protein